ncbi:MAG: histidine phosphatase family protein [Patescibacteria group bacterium]
MKTVYFVRHGQSEDNVKKVHQAPDSPLTELGFKEAAIIADRVSKLPVEAFIASPFLRTKQTAECITQKIGIQPEYNALFAEGRGMTQFIGMSETSPEAVAAYKTLRSNYGPGYHFGDEEGYDEHTARANAALDFLAKRQEEHIVVVTHGFFVRILLAHVIFNLKPTAQEIQSITWNIDTPLNTSVSLFTHDEQRAQSWRLWVWNDHAHLAE